MKNVSTKICISATIFLGLLLSCYPSWAFMDIDSPNYEVPFHVVSGADLEGEIKSICPQVKSPELIEYCGSVLERCEETTRDFLVNYLSSGCNDTYAPTFICGKEGYQGYWDLVKSYRDQPPQFIEDAKICIGIGILRNATWEPPVLYFPYPLPPITPKPTPNPPECGGEGAPPCPGEAPSECNFLCQMNKNGFSLRNRAKIEFDGKDVCASVNRLKDKLSISQTCKAAIDECAAKYVEAMFAGAVNFSDSCLFHHSADELEGIWCNDIGHFDMAKQIGDKIAESSKEELKLACAEDLAPQHQRTYLPILPDDPEAGGCSLSGKIGNSGEVRAVRILAWPLILVALMAVRGILKAKG